MSDIPTTTQRLEADLAISRAENEQLRQTVDLERERYRRGLDLLCRLARQQSMPMRAYTRGLECGAFHQVLDKINQHAVLAGDTPDEDKDNIFHCGCRAIVQRMIDANLNEQNKDGGGTTD